MKKTVNDGLGAVSAAGFPLTQQCIAIKNEEFWNRSWREHILDLIKKQNMLKTFHDHTLDTSLLKPGCFVLDVGCHGFGFGNQLRQQFQANVYEVDINDLGTVQPYYRCGISDKEGWGDVSDGLDSQARRLIPGNRFPVHTIDSFANLVGVDRWDVIKLDCEGSEYNILWNLTAPPATQISVEFHQHTAAKQSEEYMTSLLERMQRWYEAKRHRLYGKWGALNYWDSLFVLKTKL